MAETGSAAMAAEAQSGAVLPRIISVLEKVNPIVRWLFYIDGALVFLYLLTTFLDVLLRYFFDKPIPNTVDLGSMLMVALVFLGLAYVQLDKLHITIDLVTSRLSPKARLALSTAMYTICLVTIALMVWRGALNVIDYYQKGIIGYSGLPHYPASAIIPFGSIFLFIVFLHDLLAKIVEGQKLRFGAVTWLLSLGLPVLFMVFMAFWMKPILTELDLTMVGCVSIVILILFIFLGMPIAFALISMGIVFMGHALGPAAGYTIVGRLMYMQVASYNWVVIPLFMLMAYFVVASELGADAYLGAYRWIGHWRGGLGIATIGASTALAAVEGTGTAALVTLGPVAIPEMRKYKYSDTLSSGCIAAGATLGPMIPPSLGFIVYGIIVQESIGKLFIAGIIPGLILAATFVAYIIIGCRVNPTLGPPGASSSWGDRIKVLPVFLPILFIFLIVIGGIYAGVFSAMEGGGIGAFMALLVALAFRRLTWKKFKTAIRDATRFTSMIVLVIAGGMLFGNSLGASGVSSRMIEAIQGFGITPLAFVAIIIVVYILFGIICDAPIIVIITLPILGPMLKAMGIDLIWFGVLTTLFVGLGSISPPYAMNIFMLRSIACPDVPLGVMYRGIIPFCICTAVVGILILFFPILATWLPNLMR
jgi:tripartite ATP-independent transporter DctM subunit